MSVCPDRSEESFVAPLLLTVWPYDNMSWNEHHHTALLTLISDFNSCIPQSRLCGRVLHMTYSTCTQGAFSKVFKFEYFSPCGDDCAPMQRPDKICLVSLVKWFRWIYHGARSTFTCSLNSAKSFRHHRISKGVTQQSCIVWNRVGKQCCIQQETYLCMHWCNA